MKHYLPRLVDKSLKDELEAFWAVLIDKPIFKRMGNIKRITYVNHKFDEDHIVDIEIKGIYKDIFDIGIDG